MLQPDPPSPDTALLVVLSAAVSGMIGFAALTYWSMQPTVLLNVPYDTTEHVRPAPIIERASLKTSPPDVETLAIAVAARENEIQGLRPVAFAQAEPKLRVAQAAAPTTIPKPVKPRRVVTRTQHRESGHAFASNWWGGGPSQTFGGFGGWYR
jgi:hypothetical protein